MWYNVRPQILRGPKNNVWSATIWYRLQCQKFDEKIPKNIVKFGTCISGFKDRVILGISVKFQGGHLVPPHLRGSKDVNLITRFWLTRIHPPMFGHWFPESRLITCTRFQLESSWVEPDCKNPIGLEFSLDSNQIPHLNVPETYKSHEKIGNPAASLVAKKVEAGHWWTRSSHESLMICFTGSKTGFNRMLFFFAIFMQYLPGRNFVGIVGSLKK